MCIDYLEFLSRLREERKYFHMTQDEMGKAIRIVQGHYSKIENGIKRFTLYELQSLCETQIDVFYLFSGEKAIGQDALLGENLCLEQLICIIKVINMMAKCKREEELERKQWDTLYRKTKYMVFLEDYLSEKCNAFKILRVYKNLTQMEMAQILGIDVKKLRDLEVKGLLPDSELIYKLYIIFGVSPNVFLRNRSCLVNEICCLMNNQPLKIQKAIEACIEFVSSCR